MSDINEVWFALGITLFAGLATGIGSIIAFTASRTNYRFLSVATGFSAGVMLYVSFVEIFQKGASALMLTYGDFLGSCVNVISFFGGMLLIGLIDNFIPSESNPHETHSEEETAPLHDPSAKIPDFTAVSASHTANASTNQCVCHNAHDHSAQGGKLMRMGLFTAFAIAIHNFPEGLATFLAALQNPALGLMIAFAIALHNIPEGISVSVPIFYATGDRKKAFVYSFLSGLAEPCGAAVAYIFLRIFFLGDTEVIPQGVMGVLFGSVAGIMVYISVDELLPTSKAYSKGHDSILGLVAGMMVMAVSLLLFKL